MSKEDIYNKISALIQERFELKADQISDSLNFKNDLNADSIDIVEFVLELEDTFGADISDDAAEKLNTVGDAVEYIYKNQDK